MPFSKLQRHRKSMLRMTVTAMLVMRVSNSRLSHQEPA